MAKIKLLRGTGITATAPAIADGQLLFDTTSHALWVDTSPTTRIKLYDSLDTALDNITAIQDTLTGIGDSTVIAEITSAIENLKKEVVAGVANTDTVGLVLEATPDGKAKQIKANVKISAKEGNALQTITEEGKQGLYFSPDASPEYTIVEQDTAEGGYASTYYLTKNGTQIGAKINIAKDKVVKDVTLENADGEGNTGKFIKMTFQNDEGTILYLNVNDLVDTYTSGSGKNDMVVVAVNSTTNKITATITDGTITKGKLGTSIQTSLGLADTAVQPSEFATLTASEGKYIAGFTVGNDEAKTITVVEKDLPDLSALEWNDLGEVTPAP